METIKYLCDFFFNNFTHWLGLLILILCLRLPIKEINNYYNNKK